MNNGYVFNLVRITCVELASAADVSQSGEGNINSD